MANRVFSVFLLFISLYNNANTQQATEYRHGKRTVLVFRSGSDIKEVMAYLYDYSIHIPVYNEPKEVILKKRNGLFVLDTVLGQPCFVRVPAIYTPSFSAFGRIFKDYHTGGLLIEPGDSIYVAAEGGYEFERLKFSGIGSEKLNCIQGILHNTKLYVNYRDWKGDRSSSLALRDSIIKTIEKTIEIYKGKISNNAYALIRSQYVLMLVDYRLSEEMRQYLNRSKNSYSSLSSINYFKKRITAIMNDLWLNDSILVYGLFTINSFLKELAVINYCLHTGKPYSETYKFAPSEMYAILRRYLPDSRVKSRLLIYYVLSIMRNGSFMEIKTMVDELVNDDKISPAFKNVLKNELNKVDNLVVGRPAFSFSLQDTSGRFHSLEEFRGKVILIDFTSYPCGPCQALVPYLEEMEKEFRDNEVQFISIFLNNKKEDILKGVGKTSTAESLVLWDNKGFKSPMTDFYRVQGTPTLLLIDRDGKLISVPAPLPVPRNKDALKSMIRQALKPS